MRISPVKKKVGLLLPALQRLRRGWGFMLAFLFAPLRNTHRRTDTLLPLLFSNYTTTITGIMRAAKG